MLRKLRPGLPSPALVISIIALFVALGGSAFAARVVIKKPGQLGKNVVTSKQIKKNAVTGTKVKDHSLTGADLNLGALGKVPSAANADHAGAADNATHAGLADNIAAPEAYHEVGAAGEPSFLGGSSNYGTIGGLGQGETAGFYKDREGVVHLKGLIKTGTSGTLAGALFQLPAGYRPGTQKILFETVFCSASGGSCSTSSSTTLLIIGPGVSSGGIALDGYLVASPGVVVSLDGLTFRAAA
jgi:hypothetical protein